MLVFRVEKLSSPEQLRIGIGAWRAGLAKAHDDFAEKVGDHLVEAMPTPWAEPEGNPVHNWISTTAGHDHMVFGFDSIASYRRAFASKTGREEMDRRGGVLSVYEVSREHVLVGFAQVVFDSNHARRVAMLRLTDDYYAA